MMTVTIGTPWRAAVSSSIALNPNDPSPTIHTAREPGRASAPAIA